MKKRLLGVVALLILLGAIWRSGSGRLLSWFGDDDSRKRVKISSAEKTMEMGEMKFRSHERVAGKTHRPEQLVRFVLPEMEIDGLGLAAALEQVRSVYEKVCLESGEVPLAFRFVVPEGDGLRLRMKLPARSFSGSVKLLAAAAGMTVTRNELTYLFQRIEDEGGAVARRMPAPPDVRSQLAALAGIRDEEANGLDLRVLLERLGLELEPGTRVSIANGELVIDGNSAADLSKMEALMGELASEKEPQTKVTAKLLELKAGTEWNNPGFGRMTDREVQLFMREMAQIAGTNLTTLPSVMTSGFSNDAKLEIVTEVEFPSTDGTGGMERRLVGKVMNLRAGAYGFGGTVDAIFTDTALDAEKRGVSETTRLETVGFAEDGMTRISVQERPDGSRAIMLLTGELIDATGQPLRGGAR